jgi:small multidrug resistance pump
VRWLVLVAGIACNASASLLVKIAMLSAQPPSFAKPASILGSVPLLIGLVLYGGAFVLYAAAVARFPLNGAHPILTCGAIATVAILSVTVLREPMPWSTSLGIALVVGGVVLISRRVV